MRFRRSYLPVLLWWWLVPAAAAHAGELLANPEFAASADGWLADGWHDGSTALPQPAAFAVVPEGENGRPSQRVTLGGLDGGIFRLVQTIAAPAPGLYRLTMRLRALAPVQAELVLRTTPRPWTSFGSVRETVPAGAWREVIGYARVPPGSGTLDFVILLDDSGTVWLEAASLQAMDETHLTPAEQAHVERVLGPPLPPVDEARLIAETDARILAHRTAPLTVRVVNAAGRPVVGAIVRVEHLRHLFWFGAAFDWGLLPRPGEGQIHRLQREAFLRLFNAATVEFDAENYEPEPGLYRDDEVLRAVDWLSAQGLRARGHPLYWNLTTPRWLDAAAPTVDKARLWMDHLLAHASNTILPRFSAEVVFNEVVAWDRYPAPLTPVLAGDQKATAIATYLRRFKGLNPKTAAMVNDYDTTPAYYHLLREIIDEGGSLDAVGLQSHMQSRTWSVTQMWNILNRLALLNRPIYFTELSVVSGAPRDFNFRPANPPWDTTPAGEAAQADYLERFYRLAYSHPAVAGITYWDYADRSAWLGCPVGLLRKDGSPKPAYWRLDHLINEVWRTGGEYRTDAAGQVIVLQAYEGEYRITAGGIAVRREHNAARPLDARIVIDR
jgi:GH35 family endo-1,4-beta-xylanase